MTRKEPDRQGFRAAWRESLGKGQGPPLDEAAQGRGHQARCLPSYPQLPSAKGCPFISSSPPTHGKVGGSHAGSICGSAIPAGPSLCLLCPLTGTSAIWCTFSRVVGQGGLAWQGLLPLLFCHHSQPCVGTCLGPVAAKALPPPSLVSQRSGPRVTSGASAKAARTL